MPTRTEGAKKASPKPDSVEKPQVAPRGISRGLPSSSGPGATMVKAMYGLEYRLG